MLSGLRVALQHAGGAETLWFSLKIPLARVAITVPFLCWGNTGACVCLSSCPTPHSPNGPNKANFANNVCGDGFCLADLPRRPELSQEKSWVNLGSTQAFQ